MPVFVRLLVVAGLLVIGCGARTPLAGPSDAAVMRDETRDLPMDAAQCVELLEPCAPLGLPCCGFPDIVCQQGGEGFRGRCLPIE